MPKFTDAEGTVWPIKITLKTVKFVNDELGINLGEVVNNEYRAWKVREDPIEFVKVMYAILHMDRDEEMDAGEFASRLWGKSYGDAQEAYWHAYLAFCPPQLRERLERMVAAAQGIQNKFLTVAEATANKEIDLTSLTQLSQTLESSESTETTTAPES